MTVRVVLAWLEDRLRRAWTGEAEDLDDWLAGNDDAIAHRETGRRLELVAASGGEVG